MSAVFVGYDRRQPSGVELKLLARCAVGDRHRRCLAPEAELLGREAMKRAVRDRHALPPEELTDLRQFHAGLELLLDECALGFAPLPALPQGPARHRHQLGDHRAEPCFGQRARSRLDPDAVRLGDLHVPSDGLRIEPYAGRDPLLRDPRQVLPQDFVDLVHRDLSKRHRTSVTGPMGQLRRLGYAESTRGEWFWETLQFQVPRF